MAEARWTDACVLLARMGRDPSTAAAQPKLGAVQRWVRERLAEGKPLTPAERPTPDGR